MAQVAREKALTKFRENKMRVLVATDVAARGIDVQGVSHVINYTCPEDEKTYIHRIGRTGRAGASGIAVTFVDWADLHRWKMINKALELPFDEPQETYSTSPNLHHDLGIPAGTKGRIVDPAPAPERPDRAGDGRSRERARRERPERSRSSRQRSRTRGGQTVAETKSDAPAGSSEAPAGQRSDGQSRSRNRRLNQKGSATVSARSVCSPILFHKYSFLAGPHSSGPTDSAL